MQIAETVNTDDGKNCAEDSMFPGTGDAALQQGHLVDSKVWQPLWRTKPSSPICVRTLDRTPSKQWISKNNRDAMLCVNSGSLFMSYQDETQ